MHHSWPAAELGEPSQAEFCGAGSSEVELNQAKLSCRACSSKFPSRLRARMSRIPMEILWTFQGRAERSSAEPEPSSAEHFPIAHFWAQPSNGSRGPRVERRQMDPNLSCETLALKSAIRAARIEIGIQLKKIQIPRVRIHGNWGSHFLIIFSAQDRLFWRPRPRSSGQCRAESGRAPERAPASFRAGSERGSGGF